MKFFKHSELEGKHAFLSPSKYHWINYSDDKLIDSYKKFKAVQKGTELHEWASQCIKLKRKQPEDNDTVNMFVNDAIGYHMASEQPLKYSDLCFGHADAISFRNNILRIHDLKTGEIKAHMYQLEIYAAIFCLEYNVKPSEIQIILRIYQNGEIIELEPDLDDIVHIMDRIVTGDKLLYALIEQEK